MLNKRIVLIATLFLALCDNSRSQQPWRIKKGKPAGNNLVNVCLHHEKTSQNLFSRNEWRSSVESPSKISCEERFVADTRSRILFFDFDKSFEWRDGRPDDAICWDKVAGYNGCTSSFFDAFPNGINSRPCKTPRARMNARDSG